MTGAPRYFDLSREECDEVLARNHVGRLAFREGQQVDIRPVGYVARADWLFLRSAYGAKLEAMANDPFVAFEVDEIDGPFDWRSVVVHGTIYLLPTDGSPVEQREAQRAMQAIREVMPGAFTAADPVPERQILYGLHVQDVSGRMARSGAGGLSKRGQIVPPAKPGGRKPADSF